MKNLREKNSKVLALYQAVIDLMDQGMDLNTMKVIDITSQAGIGKGTAYEYFNSKEDIISEAVLYYIAQGTEALYDRVKRNTGFKPRIFTILEWMEENLERRQSLSQILKLSGNSFEVNQKIHKKFHEKREYENLRESNLFLELLIADGKQEGTMHQETNPYYLKSALISPILNYLLFLQEDRDSTEVTIEEAKQYVYKSILKLLELQT